MWIFGCEIGKNMPRISHPRIDIFNFKKNQVDETK